MTNKSQQMPRDSILIRGREVPVVSRNIEQSKLKFYAENPRVYSVLHGNGEVPTQEEIQERLLKMEHVKALIHDIRINKGLMEPLIVRDVTLDVLEGNSRLAAYRFLAKTDPVKWGYVKCTMLPHDIDDSLVFALLGQFHIKGKKDWMPYEQAGFLYRRFKKHDANLKTLALEIGMSAKRVRHLVDTYEFMVTNDEENTDRWSYYDEYLKSNKIRRAREQHPELDSAVIEMVRDGEIERAMDLREQLPVICSSPKILSKLLSGAYVFSDAYEAAVRAGGDTAQLKTVKKFREWVTRPQVQHRLLEFDGKIRNNVIFELRKIESKVRHLLMVLEKE